MKILDRLPYLDKPSLLDFPNGSVEVRAFQIVVWVRIRSSIFPAILDTGHSHNFSITDRLLRNWAGVESLPQIGEVEVNRQIVPQFSAPLWMQRNVAGTREPITSGAFALKIEHGITVVPEGTPAAPRLPLLGLRAISASGLRLIINGRRRLITVKTSWF